MPVLNIVTVKKKWLSVIIVDIVNIFRIMKERRKMLKPLKGDNLIRQFYELSEENQWQLSRVTYLPDRIVWLRNHYHLTDEVILRTLKHYQLWASIPVPFTESETMK